jgi:hypothetical protein
MRILLVACCATRYSREMVSPTDIYVLAGVISNDEESWTLRGLSARLYVDHTLVHRALRRTEIAGLYDASSQRVNLASFEELLIHAARFIAPAPLGALTRGVPAAWAAEPISELIHQAQGEPPPVWPSALGVTRGQALEPLHPAAIQASHDTPLAALLAILDSLRAGDLRIRKVAATALKDTLRRLESPHRSAA